MRLAAVAALLLAQASDDRRCAFELTLVEFTGSPSCYFDTKVREHGTLVASCTEGAAEASFRGQRFTGEAHGGVVELSSRTEFDFTDGCRWESTQRISGKLKGALSFTYSERPIRGKACLSPCPARGTLRIDCSRGACPCAASCAPAPVPKAPVSFNSRRPW